MESLVTPETVFFFDLDDTLVDTNYANFLSYKKGILSVTELQAEIVYEPNLRFNRSSLKEAIPSLTESQYELIIEEKGKHYNNFLNETTLNKSVSDILLRYSTTNKTFLVSNCRRDRALMTLDYFGLTNNFHNIFCRDPNCNDKKINKFQNAISILGVRPSNIIAFENEEKEIAAAKQAGIEIINPTFIKQ
jgi:FMN phosphatase YigB (HAD superfamily)